MRQPSPKLTITIDAYQISIKDRILGTGSIFGSGGAVNFPIVRAAIIANGNILDPTVSQTGINIFTNGANTRTRGVEMTLSYPMDVGAGKINWTLAANYNSTKITSLGTAPATLGGIPLFDQGAQSNLETASPKAKAILSALYSVGKFSLTARETMYGKTSNFTTPDGGTFYAQKIGTAFLTDLEAKYSISDALEFSVGANNVFNKRPPIVALVPGTTTFQLVNGGNVLDAALTFSPFGINGGYYYARMNVSF